MVKVRFAPSPTGTLHVGGIRTALFNYFFAKANGGIFVLRNEDTDQARKVEGSLEATLESLTWLGILWNEVVTQSTRLEFYKKYALELVEHGKAIEEEGAIRFITPENGVTEWTDAVGNKKISFENSDIESFIILKKDGFPTYHLANVVDDHLMEITHVLRGEDWIPSAPKHLMLYEAFGWQAPIFAHLPNVLGTDGKKLSKRRGAKSVLDFKNEGFLPETLLNYLMLLGWSPKDDREILSADDFIQVFSLQNVNAAPSIFDEKKLLWMNGEYIRKSQNSKLMHQIFDLDTGLKEFDPILIEGLIEPAKTRMKKLTEFRSLVEPFILEGFKTQSSDTKNILKREFEKIETWENEEILISIKVALSELNIKFPDIYEAIIGQRQGLPLAEVFEILGKKRTLSLLN